MLRSNIEQNRIAFVSESKLQVQVESANRLILTKADSQISFTEVNNQIQEFVTSKNMTSANGTNEIQVVIGLNEKNAIQPMYLELKNIFTSPTSKQELTQRYSVSSSCVLNLKTTSYTEQNKKNETDVVYSAVRVVDGETVENKTTSFSIPSGKIDVDFMQMTSPRQFKEAILKIKNPVSLIPAFGFLDLKFNFIGKVNEAAFGADFKFDRYETVWSQNDKIILSADIAIDDASNVCYFFIKDQNRKQWTLPSSFKNKIFLGQAQLGGTYFDSSLTTNYQQTNNSYILKSNKKLDYDHLSAYFTLEKKESVGQFDAYRVTEVYPPVMTGTTTPLDLEVNSTIQSDLPEIQKIAGDIVKTTQVRIDQIGLILNYLATHYSYDEEMVEKDKIRPLTTQQALDRKKGVCQHYAVLFTAIARALKIPTRIVVGYLIFGSRSELHAWVESEVSENLWQVIEPQSKEGLSTTRTRFYFPLYRGRYLEDMQAETSQENLKQYNSKYAAEPVR
jgi:hypothetical protein